MEDSLLKISSDLLAILIPIMAALVIEFLRRHLGLEKLKKIQQTIKAKEELAILAVRFVEQVYKDLHGPDKYDKAAEWLAGRFKENGLNISDSEIKGLIEAALRRLKDEFTDQWESKV